MKTDAEIKHAVLRELEWDTRVEETEIGVEVHLGTVTLTGTVNGFVKALAAIEAAHRVAGVCDVANEVRVRFPESLDCTDTDIAHMVRHTLAWHVIVPDDRITSTVARGCVTLEGEVEFWEQHDAANMLSRIWQACRAWPI